MTQRTPSPPHSPARSPRTFSCPKGAGMTSGGEAAFDAYLPPDMVLGQADIGVLVADRLGHVVFLNEYASRLFGTSDDPSQLAGSPVLSLGLFSGDDRHKMKDIVGQILRGRSWEGTFEAARG